MGARSSAGWERPSPPIFDTARLRLRVIGSRDKPFLTKLDSDPLVMRYIHAGTLSPAAAAQNARVQIELTQYRWHFHRWLVQLRDKRARISIGWMELSKFPGQFDRDDAHQSDDINLGYQFDPAYWGRGFAGESAGAVLRHAFETLRLHRVVAYAQPGNARSIRVLEKLGFQAGSRADYKDEGGNVCRLFALTADRWRKVV